MTFRNPFYTAALALLSGASLLVAQETPVPPVPPVPQPQVEPEVVEPTPGAPAAPPAPAVPATPPTRPTIPAPPIPGIRNNNANNQQAALNVDNNLPLAERQVVGRVEFPKLNGNALAGLYRQYTGRRVIVSSAAAQVEISFVQEPPLTNGEAAELLMKAALMEGLVFVPSGENTDKLVVATQGQKPHGLVPLVADADDLPQGDQVVSYVMTLNYIKPSEALRVFTQYITQVGSYGSIAEVPNASAIVITENSAILRHLIELRDKIDVASAQVQTRFVKVEHADVQELAEKLNEILNQQQQSKQTAGVERARTVEVTAPGGGNVAVTNSAAAAVAGGGGAGEDQPVQIVPDSRTNRVFVMGRPIDLVFVEGLIREFDTPTSERNYLRRKLRFLAVSDFLPVAGDALNRAFSSQAQGGGGGGGAVAAGGGRTTGGRTTGGGSNRSSTSAFGGSNGSSRSSSLGGSSTGGGSGGGSGGIGGGGDALGDPEINSAPQSLLVGRTLLVADNITNSIVVQGPPHSLEIINQLLDQIDVKAEQVMISTVFGQLTLGDNLEYGLDVFRTLNLDSRDDVAAGNQNGRTFLDPADFSDLANLPGTGPLGAPGLSVYGKIGRNIGMYLKALEENSDFKVLSRPTIFTANNQKGVIRSGTQIAVPTSTQSSVSGNDNNVLSTNIDYKDVELKLEVIPLVNSSEEVTLQIYLVSQDLGEFRQVGDNNIQDVINRELLTTVTVPNNQTVVLGGLITTTFRNGVSGVPILSRIPGLGKLFSTTTKEEQRSELLIFIRPQIVGNSTQLDAVNAELDNRYEISNEARQFDDPVGVLPPKGDVVEQNGKNGAAAPVQRQEMKTSKPRFSFLRGGKR